jgi:hypothetical protein
MDCRTEAYLDSEIQASPMDLGELWDAVVLGEPIKEYGTFRFAVAIVMLMQMLQAYGADARNAELRCHV